MKVRYIKETEDFVRKLSVSDVARVYRIRNLFIESGFSIGPKYIKKVSRNIWELRAGRIRLLLFMIRQDAICVHAFYKKTQKLPKKDLDLAEKRSRYI